MGIAYVLASLSWLAENWPLEAFKRRTRGEETPLVVLWVCVCMLLITFVLEW